MRRTGGKKREPAERGKGAHHNATGHTTRLAELRNHWIESDSYDRATLQRLTMESPSLAALVESGSKLLPHFDGFVLDLFALLFKMNAVVHPPEQVVPSAGFYKLVLNELQASPALEVLRRQTVLDETRAGLATLLLGDRLLALLKSERILSRAEMLDYWNLEQQEREIAGQQAQAETALDLRKQAAPPTQRQLD